MTSADKRPLKEMEKQMMRAYYNDDITRMKNVIKDIYKMGLLDGKKESLIKLAKELGLNVKE